MLVIVPAEVSMPQPVRFTLIAIGLAFVVGASSYSIRSERAGERLDRTKEGWAILIGIRLTALLLLASTAAFLYNLAWFVAVAFPPRQSIRWVGVAGFACAAAWLLWMYHSLGRNLTDTVVTRRDATFVEDGPYRFVRNPMYIGVLAAGLSLGFVLGTWLQPLLAWFIFALLVVRTKTEEKYLIERFDDQYRAYMTRVGRFFPKLGSARQ